MQAAIDYLESTSSAVKHLFAGIEDYVALLRPTTELTFVSGQPAGPEREEQFRRWLAENEKSLDKAREAQTRFVAESFALSTLCGAVLQVAEKALELYSPNKTIPADLPLGLKSNLKLNRAQYCVGRLVRRIPLGLIIYAGRNQHAHHEELPREPGFSVFEHLAAYPEFPDQSPQRNKAFDVRGGNHSNYAGNITSLIGWRSYEAYVEDMRSMLRLDTADRTGLSRKFHDRTEGATTKDDPERKTG
ncbi:hypothetical protein [Variovorax paradoxus]|uniref:hypothetical protein n=1 Tax=Variovorax paradoxus TaxID=34073 RepID=UPI0029C6D61C|nr:hypothetical protein [Variovorax paradoxus]WPH20799.1 hypothetical protein RZE78_01240 [Variovorax paradoxus]